MTPAEHIAAAEQILTEVQDTGDDWLSNEVTAELLVAVAHALIAIAVESGVPHQTQTPAGS